jgi:uncharacterized damage-inducible protein DinB
MMGHMAGKRYPDMWVDPEDDPRSQDPLLAGETETLVEYLRNYRLTLEMKCAGLDAEQLARRSVPPSTLSLLGLVRHMAEVERSWFREVLAGEPRDKLFITRADRDADFNGAVADAAVVAEAFRIWKAEIANAERFVREAESLDVISRGERITINLREVLVHMIEEYARHCGHADLLRECIDGAIGQ